MGPIKELADDLYRERILRARRTPSAEKLLDGATLFDMACRVTLAGIRAQHPNAAEEEVRRILADRLALRERLERSR